MKEKYVENKELSKLIDRMINKIQILSIPYIITSDLKIEVKKIFEFNSPTIRIMINNRRFISLKCRDNNIIQLLREYKRRVDFYNSKKCFFENERDVYKIIEEEFIKYEKRNNKYYYQNNL